MLTSLLELHPQKSPLPKDQSYFKYFCKHQKSLVPDKGEGIGDNIVNNNDNGAHKAMTRGIVQLKSLFIVHPFALSCPSFVR